VEWQKTVTPIKSQINEGMPHALGVFGTLPVETLGYNPYYEATDLIPSLSSVRF